jgi:hypothetical protein
MHPSVASQALTQSAILLLPMLTDFKSPPERSTKHSMRKVAPLSAMKTVLFAAGQVGLVEVGRAEDEEIVEEEFEYETTEELVKDPEEEDPDVVDAVDEMLEEELSILPTQMAPRTLELLTGVPILLFI